MPLSLLNCPETKGSTATVLFCGCRELRLLKSTCSCQFLIVDPNVDKGPNFLVEKNYFFDRDCLGIKSINFHFSFCSRSIKSFNKQFLAAFNHSFKCITKTYFGEKPFLSLRGSISAKRIDYCCKFVFS